MGETIKNQPRSFRPPPTANLPQRLSVSASPPLLRPRLELDSGKSFFKGKGKSILISSISVGLESL